MKDTALDRLSPQAQQVIRLLAEGRTLYGHRPHPARRMRWGWSKLRTDQKGYWPPIGPPDEVVTGMVRLGFLSIEYAQNYNSALVSMTSQLLDVLEDKKSA